MLLVLEKMNPLRKKTTRQKYTFFVKLHTLRLFLFRTKKPYSFKRRFLPYQRDLPLLHMLFTRLIAVGDDVEV